MVQFDSGQTQIADYINRETLDNHVHKDAPDLGSFKYLNAAP
jgi:hypothetical protein